MPNVAGNGVRRCKVNKRRRTDDVHLPLIYYNDCRSRQVPDVVQKALKESSGDVLVFLAGEDCIDEMTFALHQQGEYRAKGGLRLILCSRHQSQVGRACTLVQSTCNFNHSNSNPTSAVVPPPIAIYQTICTFLMCKVSWRSVWRFRPGCRATCSTSFSQTQTMENVGFLRHQIRLSFIICADPNVW